MRASGEESAGRPRDEGAGSNDPGRSSSGTRDGRATAEATARPRETSPRRTGGRPKWPIPLALLGVLALALAAILAWGVAPTRKQLPETFNTTRDLAGTATALLNTQALQSGNFGGVLVANQPVTAQDQVRVLEVSGNAARVENVRTLMTDGQTLGSTTNTYAVNRQSLEPVTNVPTGWDVQQPQGLTVAFPINAQQQEYSAWVPDLQSTTPIRFVREEARGGVNTFVYESNTPPSPIRDQTVLASLPSTLSRSALLGLTPSLPITPEQRAMLAEALPSLPEQVPVTYTYEGGATYWVEPKTGTIVDMQQQVIRNGTISGPGGAVLSTLPVFNVAERFTDGTVVAAARDANDRNNAATTVGSTWPGVLTTLGAIALLAGLVGLFIRRRPQPHPVPAPAYRPDDRTTTVDTDAERRIQAGQPQPPYVGQTPHTGPYREPRTGQEQPGPAAASAEEEAGRGQQSGQQGGQPPRNPGG
jgi:Porin PorA